MTTNIRATNACTASLVAICAIASLAGIGYAQTPPATFTKSDLLGAVQSATESTGTIRVSFRCDVQNPDESQGHALEHQTIQVKWPKTLWEVVYSQAPQFDPTVYARIVAYNGAQTVSQQTTFGQATVQAGRHFDADTRGKGFFDLAMLNPAVLDRDQQGDDMSLFSVLRSPMSTVRGTQEQVGGRWCHVVDWANIFGGPTLFAVWIDCERGFLPMRHVYYHDSGTPYLEFMVEEAAQVASGEWVPIRGWKQLSPRAGVPGASGGPRWNIVVDHDSNGQPAVAINEPLDDEIFNLADHLPPGFKVANLDSGRVWTMASRDFERGARSLDAALVNAELKIRRHGVPIQATTADIATRGESMSVAAMTLGAVFAAGTGVPIVAWGSRRRRRQAIAR